MKLDSSTIKEKWALESIQKFITNTVATLTGKSNLSKENMKELWEEFAKGGLFGISLKKETYGLELSHKFQWEIIRKISYENPSIGLSYLAHNILVAKPLAENITNTQQQKYLQDIISGQAIASCAMSETEAGSDIMSMKSIAIEKEDHYLINAHKIWITNSPYCDYILLYCKLDETEKNNIAIFIIQANSKNIDLSKPLEKIGMKDSPTGEITIKNLKVPKYCRIDNGKNAKKILFTQLDYERLMLSACTIGIMDWCMKTSINHCKMRKQFKKSIGNFQLIQEKIAMMYTNKNAAISFCEKLLNIYDKTGVLDNKNAASAYLFCSDHVFTIATECIQCLGANGYMQYSKAGSYLQDAKLFQIGGGTSEIRKWIIARSLLDL